MKKATNPVLIIALAIVAAIVGYVVAGNVTRYSFRSGNFSLLLLFFLAMIALMVGVLWWALKNNRSVSNATPAERQAILETPPAPGYGRILVYRDNFVGMAAGVDILLDGQSVAQLKSPRFVALDLPAGTYGIAAHVQGKQTDPLPVPLAAGQVAVVKAAMILGGVLIDMEENPDAARTRMAGIRMVRPDSHGAASVFA